MAGNKFLKNNAGTITEEAALQASTGVEDAGKLVALDESGVLDSSIINSVDESTGASDAGKVVALDDAGRIDVTMMPAGFGDDAVIVVTSEALSAGDVVNIWNDTGTPKARKADATTAGKEGHGFVLESVGSGGNATVYFEGQNTSVSGLTAGALFLSTTAGGVSSTAPTGAGNVVQRVGFATSSSAFNFQSNDPIVLA
jgi:hypothetical protein